MNLRQCLLLPPVLLACLALAVGSRCAAQDVPRVIFDSDMSSDHDDVGDIATLHGLASLGEIQIIGMMVSSKNYGTAQFMDAVNTWYGKPDIPIGIPPDIGGVGEYPGTAIGTGRWPHTMGATKEAGLASGDCLWAKDLYRKLLAASPDHSVVIVTTGYVQNVEALMKSTADGYSALSGIDLIRQKVKLLSCAGGDYPRGSEFNFRVGDTMPRPAYTVVNDWPTAAWFVSYNMGQSIYTGGLLPEARADSPIRYVYVDSNSEDYPYPSWGQQMVYFAARGLDTFWDGHATGRNNTDTEGSNWWTETPELTGAQEQGYLLEKVRTPVQESIDALIMLEPNNGSASKPGQPSNLRATVVGGNRVDLQWRDNAFNESGFRVERGINGVYTQIGSVGANVTAFSDTGLASSANVGYRVKAYNGTGDSRYASTWVYSGWTAVGFSGAPDGPFYTSYQPGDLRYIDGIPQYEHVVLNNDSTHGQNLTIAVDAGATDNQGVFYVYFLYQNADNWYRLVYDNRPNQQQFRFEKRIAGTTATVGSPRALTQTLPVQNSEHALHAIGGGSLLRKWQIQVAPGSLSFQTSQQYLTDAGTRPTSTISLNVSETLSLTSGLIGLGSFQQRPIWENFRFTTGATAALAPSIVSHPQNTSVFAGRSVTLSVAASGTGPLTYQWKHGTTVVGTSSATLTIASAQMSDAGSYVCIVSNSAGTATSNAATLTVNAVVAPAITTQPLDSLVPVGDTAIFTVIASGTAPLTYQWKKGAALVGTDSATLSIPNAQAGDAGSYACTVSNSAGTATSNAATLTLTAALDPLIASTALFNDNGGTYGGYPNTADKAFDGSTGTFYDAATGTGAFTGIDAGSAATVTAVRYYARAGQVGRMIGGVFEGSNAQGSGYVTLATVASASDTAWTTMLVNGAAAYRYLRYRGPAGGCCNVAEIEFHGTTGAPPASVAPAITGQPANRTATVGQTATFSVVASGTPAPTYQWQRNGSNIAGATSATYTTPAAVIGDSGATFRCVVTNSAGSATSNAAILTVHLAAVAPAITTDPQSVAVTAGQTATFTVAASGSPVPSYQWQRNGVDISGATEASYTISATAVGDSGATFRCVATNSAGSATSNAATLTVTAPGAGLDPLITWAAVINDGGGAWGGSGNTADKAFDGDTATFYDPTNGFGAYTGIDVGAGSAVVVTAIRFRARAGWPDRMAGGTFEGSNAPTSGYTALATVASASDTAWTTLTVAGAAAYRYLRFRTPESVWCNVAEIEFHGTAGTPAPPTPTAPSITGQPVDTTVMPGQTASFTVIANSTAPLNYQWMHGGIDVGNDNATLTISNAQAADAGSYTCVVSNDAGSATSTSGILTVMAPTPPPAAPSAPIVIGNGTRAPVVAGSGTAGATIHLYEGATEIGTATIAGDGGWTYALTGATDGTHSIAIAVSDTHGLSARSPAVSVTKDSTIHEGLPPGSELTDNGGGCGAGNLTPVIAGLTCLLVAARVRR